MNSDFKIIDYAIKPIFNDECIICFENINKTIALKTNDNNERKGFLKTYFLNFYKEEDNLIHPRDYLDIKRTNIILSCGHNYHSECFVQYIIHKLYRDDFAFVVKTDWIKCPICRHNFKCSSVYQLFKEYKKLLHKDAILLTKRINKLSNQLKYQKVMFSMRRLIKKDIYIGEIYNYYKIKRTVKYLKDIKRDISKSIYILKYTKIYK